MIRKYILSGHTPVPTSDLLEWGRWMQNANKHIADDTQRGIRVITIFLGLDKATNLNHIGPPVLFETMVFGEENDEERWRYCTWEEAEAGHIKVCKAVF